MSLITNLYLYIKGIFLFKKYSYLVLSFILTILAAFSEPLTTRAFTFLKSKLDTEQVILTGSISIGVFCVTFIVVGFEYFTGLMAIGKEEKKERNSKTLEGIFKMILYGIWIFIIFSFQMFSNIAEYNTMISVLGYIMFFSASLINLWEFKNSGLNLKTRFGKEYKIFKIVDKITTALENKVGTFLEKSICKK